MDKKYGFYFGLVLTALLVTACNKDDENPDLEVWKQQNNQVFNDLAHNPDYTELRLPGSAGSIYYRVIQKGEGKRIYYNSRAEIYYKGWFVVNNNDFNIKVGDLFGQRLFDDGTPYKIAISAQVIDDNGIYTTWNEGGAIALQHMVEGDKWEIWIPYRYGYKEAGSSAVPGYSTLAYEVELVKAINLDEFNWSNPNTGSDD